MCISAYLSILKFICQMFIQSTSLLRSSCNPRTSSWCLDLWQDFVWQIWIFFSWLFHCLDHCCRWGKAVGPEHYLVGHLMSLVSSCWRFGSCRPYGAVLLVSSGSIGLHSLGYHDLGPCQMPFESPGRLDPLLCCYPRRRCQWHGQRNQSRLLRRMRLFLKPCWESPMRLLPSWCVIIVPFN